MKTSFFQPLVAACVFAVAAHAQTVEHGERAERAAPHVQELPRSRVDVRVGNQHYYEHRGTFYRPGTHGYVVVRPPRGAIIPRLPPRAVRIYFGGGLYYQCDDIYYESTPEGYVVVDPPAGAPAPAVVAAAPATGYQTIYVGATQYFFRNGQFYQQTPEGMVWTPAPIGAITPSLPADATSVWYQDIEYFNSDDVYFRKTPDGYRVVNAPWLKN